MYKAREQQWREAVKKAKLSVPNNYLKSQKEFIKVLKQKKTPINKNLLGESNVWINNSKEEWQKFREIMWAKRTKWFQGPTPDWFLNNIPSHLTKVKFEDYTNMGKTKILILGDTHLSNNWIDLIKEIKPDLVIHTGDFEKFGNPGEYINIETKKTNLNYWTNGNHEITNEILRNNLDPSSFEEIFKQVQVFKIQNKKILLTHFFDEEDRMIKTTAKITGKVFDVFKWKKQIIKKYNPDFIITGHTHVPKIEKEKYDDKIVTVINPGSLADPRPSDNNKKQLGTYVVAIAKNGKFRFKIKYLKR